MPNILNNFNRPYIKLDALNISYLVNNSTSRNQDTRIAVYVAIYQIANSQSIKLKKKIDNPTFYKTELIRLTKKSRRSINVVLEDLQNIGLISFEDQERDEYGRYLKITVQINTIKKAALDCYQKPRNEMTHLLKELKKIYIIIDSFNVDNYIENIKKYEQMVHNNTLLIHKIEGISLIEDRFDQSLTNINLGNLQFI